MKKILFIFFLFFIANSITLSSLKAKNFIVPDPPTKIYPIQDYANVLSKTEITNLNKKLISFSNKNYAKILICIINSNHNNNQNFITQQWGEKWGIGDFHKNNGIIVLISIGDRKISIQNGYGIEPFVTDFQSAKIIEKMKPFLRKNLFYKSINICTDEISKILEKKIEKENFKKKEYFSIIHLLSLIFIIIMIFYISLIGDNNSLLLFNPFIFTNIFFRDNKNLEDDDTFEGFGNGGDFGGGGSESSW
ncbi:TPM domain-containing protein [Blattabacterium cuenoti]|uniref:TPM domain-containing protein n=1 Tax=Blattabacterium cuenoti TaxID=1653831 RepID=UPI00163BC5C1|nr:TPM domain-containing protein [Blattabacterium cuenoti]